MRHIEIMCDDRKHIICCLENIEEEFRRNEEQSKVLQSARRMARMDALTGIRNKTAFTEYSATVDAKLKAVPEDCRFGVIMCDVNDLKKINDTRGHSFGDEAIQRTSRLICDVFDHSPVFRVGGDEFVVVLDGRDYDMREQLLAKLREESLANKRSRSGPVVACGMAVYDRSTDDSFDSVYKRADMEMYENKKELKSMKQANRFTGMNSMPYKRLCFERPGRYPGIFRRYNHFRINSSPLTGREYLPTDEGADSMCPFSAHKLDVQTQLKFSCCCGTPGAKRPLLS